MGEDLREDAVDRCVAVAQTPRGEEGSGANHVAHAQIDVGGERREQGVAVFSLENVLQLNEKVPRAFCRGWIRLWRRERSGWDRDSRGLLLLLLSVLP